jgi:hypothetical protein
LTWKNSRDKNCEKQPKTAGTAFVVFKTIKTQFWFFRLFFAVLVFAVFPGQGFSRRSALAARRARSRAAV